MKNRYTIIPLFSLIIFFIIVFIGVSSCLNGIGFCIVYELIYGITLSILVPIMYVKTKENLSLSSFGIKKLRVIDYIIILIFVAFSICGQLFTTDLSKIDFSLFPLSIMPLLMTTFFEEFLFRGFMQTRFEKNFGAITAIVLSGFIFSIYHLGYPGFRNFNDIILLFFVGIMFAVPFKLSNNNLIVSYFINLPNAYLTYLLKFEQFPNFSLNFTIICIIGLILTIFIFRLYFKKYEKQSYSLYE
ncbi:CPBP family intramembrane glutamic endopeptidase [Clostridium sp.]|uniref:CPBP family intramembrane glutamic endopeptidase n=1 Tax=Clostridium sp. TaxID=1506 RepID=UPI00283BAA62|nr:CPBP family intramembrane glutamic endopeptidase [Clostridium sp.]MDR3598024.1 CPBP family intramembrane metalloprotease [Clostridium sp.]